MCLHSELLQLLGILSLSRCIFMQTLIKIEVKCVSLSSLSSLTRGSYPSSEHERSPSRLCNLLPWAYPMGSRESPGSSLSDMALCSRRLYVSQS